MISEHISKQTLNSSAQFRMNSKPVMNSFWRTSEWVLDEFFEFWMNSKWILQEFLTTSAFTPLFQISPNQHMNGSCMNYAAFLNRSWHGTQWFLHGLLNDYVWVQNEFKTNSECAPTLSWTSSAWILNARWVNSAALLRDTCVVLNDSKLSLGEFQMDPAWTLNKSWGDYEGIMKQHLSGLRVGAGLVPRDSKQAATSL